jgi:hypothetical protein
MDNYQLITIGISLYKENKYSEAIDYFNQLITTDSNCYQAYHYRGLVCRRQRDDQGAIADLQKADTLIADKEYTNICQKLQNLIGKDYSHSSNNENNDNDEFYYIEYEGNWHLEQEIVEINGQINSLLSWIDRYLPQGAPSSPAITNILCRRLDRKLNFMAKQYGFDYTRYADDLTFSASGKSLVNINNILKLTNLIVKKEDFEINENKIRVVRNYRRQEVTGVIVNEKLNIPRDKLKTFRAVLYKIEKDGLQNYTWGQSKDIIAAIEGFANFVAMVNPEKGGKFIEQIHRIKEKYVRKREKVVLVHQEFLTQSNIIKQINDKLREVRFNKIKKRQYLQEIYNKKYLQELTDEELLEFLHYLITLQAEQFSFGDTDDPLF